MAAWAHLTKASRIFQEATSRQAMENAYRLRVTDMILNKLAFRLKSENFDYPESRIESGE